MTAPGVPAHPFARYDFHSHTFLTDGETSATEMWRYAVHLHHEVLAVTDHIATEDPKPLLDRLRAESRAWEDSPVIPLIGVEVTHIPPRRIGEVVRSARRAGAEVVIVHGETIMEEVMPGTNRAALETGEVDILAHPGLMTREEAELARAHNTILEISARRGHAFTNGHVARLGMEVGAQMAVDSDAHAPQQLVTAEAAHRIARGAGIPEERLRAVLEEAPRALLKRVRRNP